MARLEGKVRQLELKRGDKKKGCRTCTRGLHEGRCPGFDWLDGSSACKKPKTPTKAKKKKEKEKATARQADDSSEAASTDIEEANRVMELNQVSRGRTKPG